MKNFVIVGASSGIGRELAEQLLHAGEYVVLCSRKTNLLSEFCDRYPLTTQVHFLDVTDTMATMEKLVSIFRSLSSVDCLVLGSGIGEFNPGLDFDIEKSTLQTNVWGFTAVADCAFNLFREQGSGHLVAITSIAGLRGGFDCPAYNASKAYQINYLEALQVKAAKLNLPVFVTDVRPGLVDTAMAKGEGLFWVSSVKKAARQIIVAIGKRKKVVYITKRWRLIALVLNHLPKGIYSRI